MFYHILSLAGTVKTILHNGLVLK